MKKTVSVALLFVGVIMILVGIYHKQYLSVISKAVKVCLECVGIG